MQSRQLVPLMGYQHRRLHTAKSIRILKLYPAEHSKEPLRGRLIEVSLDQDPQYEALSYAWGSEDRVRELECNSGIYHITFNCWQALRRLRYRDEPRFLWIDSVCIDQDSHRERNHQVGLMGEIYSRADRVLVWLGKGDYKTRKAVKYLKSIATESGSELRRWLTLDMVLDRKIVKVMDRDSSVLSCLNALFEREWFDRVWPIQEIALSQKCVVLCGDESIALDDLMNSLESLRNVTYTSDEIHRVHFHKEMWRCVREYSLIETWKWNVNSCSAMLLKARFQNASEPRDKIFAFHGLFERLGVRFPMPDYSKSVSQIYTEAAYVAITNDNSLEILSGVTGEPGPYGALSWVPDWSNSRPISEIIWYKHEGGGSIPPRYQFWNAERLLTLQGVAIDRIEETSLVFPEFNEFLDSSIAEVEVLCTWRSKFEKYSIGRDMAGFFDRFCGPSWVRAYHNVDLPPSEKWLKAIRRYKADSKTTLNRWLKLWGDVYCPEKSEHGHAVLYLFNMLTIKPPSGTGPLRMHQLLRKLLDRKTMFRTRRGGIGVGSMFLRAGDSIGLFAGCNLPMIIRKDKVYWRFVAPAYLDGVMFGSEWPDERSLGNFTFV
ncbi:HET-domain-containing protein [Lojkania enalia]|uniref:HET-domain-containing protein n=1 Tax=Lojkania enalia TaxID=147567 RepID=A0A9P4K802_9PLEO|nr:HET-domain-containing protein [Didymosphaeria enalia]